MNLPRSQEKRGGCRELKLLCSLWFEVYFSFFSWDAGAYLTCCRDKKNNIVLAEHRLQWSVSAGKCEERKIWANHGRQQWQRHAYLMSRLTLLASTGLVPRASPWSCHWGHFLHRNSSNHFWERLEQEGDDVHCGQGQYWGHEPTFRWTADSITWSSQSWRSHEHLYKAVILDKLYSLPVKFLRPTVHHH